VQASLIPGLIGWGRARELLYFGDIISSDKAHEWGFVNDVVEKEDLDTKIRDWEEKFSAAGPRASMEQKALMRVSTTCNEFQQPALIFILELGRTRHRTWRR
jgi:enoyl-CoA hydratase